jgi:DNA-binding beta-propeller fold protein YncE
MTTSVLLSFSEAYAPLARRIAGDLRASQINVILDQWEGGGGAPSRQSVPRSVGDARFVLPLLTPSKGTRSWLGSEWEKSIFEEARRRAVHVLPIRGELAEDVPDFLENLSFADFRNRGYALELRRLIQTIRRLSDDSAITLPEDKDDAMVSKGASAEPTPHPIVLLLGEAVAGMAGHDAGLRECKDRIGTLICDGLFYELGVPFPGLEMRTATDVPEWSGRLLINGFEEAQMDVQPGSVLVNAPVDMIRRRGFAAEAATNPANGNPCAWIASEQAGAAEALGLTTWDGREFLILWLSTVLRRKAAHFIGMAEAHAMLSRLAAAFPHLVAETIPAAVSEFVFADVLRRLLEENTSVRNLPRILMSLAEWGREEDDPLVLTEYVRMGLQRQITWRVSRGMSGPVIALLLDRHLEREISCAARRTSTATYVDLPPHRVAAILETIGRSIGRFAIGPHWPVLIAIPPIRSYVRRLIAPSFPKLEVISHEEVRPEATIRPLGRIGLDGFDESEAHMDGVFHVWYESRAPRPVLRVKRRYCKFRSMLIACEKTVRSAVWIKRAAQRETSMYAILGAMPLALAALVLSAVAEAQVYVSSIFGDVGRFDAQTGAGGIIIPSAAGVHARGVLIGPDGNLYVSGGETITRRDPVSGALLETFEPSPTSTVNSSADLTAMALGRDGYLYATDTWHGAIVRYDIATGSSIDIFVSPSDLALEPHGLAFTPDGTSLLVSSDLTNRIRRYDAATGAAAGFFGPDDGLPSGQIVFGPDGNLYVPDRFHDNIRRYDAAGAYLGVFAAGGGMTDPFGLAFGRMGICTRAAGTAGSMSTTSQPAILSDPSPLPGWISVF